MIAAKAFDPVVGVDIHIIQPPGPVPPVPIPHPFIGMLIDPMDFAPVIGATVMVNGMPRATAGTGGQCIPPHIPIGGVFVKPPANECEIFMGSSTVLADDDPLSFLGMPALSCHDVGMPPPPRLKKKRKPKSLTLPTSVVLAVPGGAPVLVGGPPTISMMALGMKAAMAGLGKAFKKLRKVQKGSKKMKGLSDKAHAAAKKAMDKLGVPPSVQNRIHKSICTVTGHPVDVATGKVFTEAVDLEIDGQIPIRWDRTWYSTSTYVGPLGHGWHHEYDTALIVGGGAVAIRLRDGRPLTFPELPPGATATNDQEGLTLLHNAQGYAVTRAGLLYRFAPAGRGEEHSLIRIESDTGAHISFRYDAGGRLVQVADSTGETISVVWNARQRIEEIRAPRPDQPGSTYAVVRYEYDANDDLVTVYDALQNAFRYSYENHLLVRETDRRGYSFLFRYDGTDSTARCVRTWGEDGIFAVQLTYEEERTLATFDAGGTWIYRHDGALVTELIDPYGGVQQYVPDELGRVVEEVDPSGEVTELEYNSVGEHIRRVNAVGHAAPPADVEPDPPDPNTYELPDTPLQWEHGDLVPEDMGTGPDEWIMSQVPLPVRAELLKRRRIHRREPIERFDLLGRLVARYYADGTTSEWSYDPEGNVVSYKDRDGSITQQQFTSHNLLTAEIDPLGNTTRYAYSPSEEPIRIVDPGGTEHEFVHDLKDRNTEVRVNGRLLDAYVYDVADNLIERRAGDGRLLVQYEIGPGGVDAHRLLASGETHEFTYDKAGRIISATAAAVPTALAYNDDGARIRDVRVGHGVEHEIDQDGILRQSTYFGKFAVGYARDSRDPDVLVVTDPTGTEQRFSIGWDRELLKRLSNGSTELVLYDEDGRCTGKHHWKVAAEHTIWSRSYEYSPAGDLKAGRDTAYGSVQYEYDAAHRLTREVRSDGRTAEYSFDAAGNLTRQPGVSGLLVGRANQLIEASGDLFAYNDRGHVASRRGRSGDVRYEYDALDLLTRVTIDGEVWEATYDALGRRTSKTWRGRTAQYWWDDFRLAAEQRFDGTFRIYIYPDHHALVPFMFVEYDSREANAASGRLYFIFTNHLGVPVRVEDSQGETVWAAEVDPFGSAHHTVDGIEMPLRFPGHYYDVETGLHYNRFRYYSPELGRYLQVDPLGVGGGVNLYCYSTNPLVEVDIDGLKKCSKPKAKAKAGGKKRSGPKKKQLKPGERGSYKDLKKKTGKGKMDRDHIPSKAALIKRAEKIKGDIPLTPKQRNRIIEESETVAVPKQIHKEGPTYGSKNTPPQIKKDAANLEEAARRDADAMLKNAKKHYPDGKVPQEIKDSAKAIKKTQKEYDDFLKSIVKPKR
jgi:RHS repeat-associated protein